MPDEAMSSSGPVVRWGVAKPAKLNQKTESIPPVEMTGDFVLLADGSDQRFRARNPTPTDLTSSMLRFQLQSCRMKTDPVEVWR
ncbi:hypothetical protein OG613_03800 [Streptomyces sp. NBC_00015]|uniref:hypothetical protein n=1 Tax=Streptomyces sp. NBC_00015 TaxID=2903611 RepID=UPI00324F4153